MSDTSGDPRAPSGFRVGPEWDPDRYVLGAAVGSGAEGILYRGSITTGTGVELDVAVKMLQPRFLDQLDRWHERWTEQVELLRSLQVPGVVPVRDGFIGPLPHGAGQPGQGRTLYLVMNWVEGEPIDEWVRHRPARDPLDDLKILVQVGAALDLMHSGRATGGVPIVHRDVKPSNIIVTDSGAVLVDFGLTRGLADEQRLTGITGTPGYLAPESVEDGRYSPASDRYAFGGVAYFVITGLEPPADHQPDGMRTTLATAPATAGRPDVVDHLMAMLDADPEQRPAGLANWIGQVRQSSLQPGPEALSPPAPRRSVDSAAAPAGDRRRRGSPNRRALTIGGIAALVVVAAVAAFAVRASTSGPGTPKGAQGSGHGAPVSYRFTGAFDPTCGGGRFVPFPSYVPLVRIPAALGVGATGAVLGYNFAAPAASGLPQTQLYPIGPNCSANPQFVAATDNNPAPLPSINALAIDDTSGDVYAAGYDQGGWVVVRYQPSGGLDPTFGVGGFVNHPTAASGSASPAGGWPTQIVETPSKVYVVGWDGGPNTSSRTLLVSLLKNGTFDPQFNAAATKGIVITGVRVGSVGQTMAVTPAGYLLVGGSYAGRDCATFSIDEYQPTGQPVASFQPVSISGTGTSPTCGGSPVIPGFTAAQLSSIVALRGGGFDAVGYAFVSDSSVSGVGNLTGFVARFRQNGSIDTSFGRRGMVLLPGLRMPGTTFGTSNPGPNMLGAVSQPDGGLVVAMLDPTGVGLVHLSPSGALKGRVEIPLDPTAHPAIATGDAGRGRLEIVTFTDTEWQVGRYLGVQPTRNAGG